MNNSSNVLDAIGGTSMVQLRRVVPPGCGRVLVKLEWENPTGSMKDRAAQAMIARAEADSRPNPGDTGIEYTGGSTGTSLALVCAARGYRLHIVTSDAFSRDKLDQRAALGAVLTLVPRDGGMTTCPTTRPKLNRCHPAGLFRLETPEHRRIPDRTSN